MRTTLTLDPDVARMVADEAHRQRKPVKQIVNDALRRGLAPSPARARVAAYRVRAHSARLRPGLDRAKLNALADDLDDGALVAKLRTGRRS